jgi:hypothetical protein
MATPGGIVALTSSANSAIVVVHTVTGVRYSTVPVVDRRPIVTSKSGSGRDVDARDGDGWSFLCGSVCFQGQIRVLFVEPISMAVIVNALTKFTLEC